MLALTAAAISDREFGLFRDMLHAAAGISLSPEKKVMVGGRLARRLRHYGLTSYGEYFKLLAGGDRAELQVALDLLTTNETHFFREPKHFDFLRERLRRMRAGAHPVRAWSAASSSGEEAWSIAMTLAESLGARAWEVVGSDISSRVLDRARAGIYERERIKTVPAQLLGKYFLRGIGGQEGKLQIAPELRARVRFLQVNLNAPLPEIGKFDFIFLRNVMIYFDQSTKREVVARMLPLLKPEGRFIVGHSESLHGVSEELASIRPTIYCRECRRSRRQRGSSGGAGAGGRR